ncbi:outer membrane beta-barrel protein [Aquabacterium sp.]|uniref:outer membrane beta-barrel protein n=1 Tax=Aquabacterium sp. TaxID=1872578 RepID=UPI00378430A1
MSKLSSSIVLLSISLLGTAATLPAQAADKQTGYIGGAIGRSSFNAHDLNLPNTGGDERDTAGKLYGGYQFNETFGIEGGYVRLGKFSERVTLGSGNTVTQEGRARSLYLAGTARLPLNEQFSLNGRLGLSAGRVSGSNILPTGSQMTGSTYSTMLGVGAEYKVSQYVALTLDFDHYGRLSDKISGNLVSAGVRFSF